MEYISDSKHAYDNYYTPRLWGRDTDERRAQYENERRVRAARNVKPTKQTNEDTLLNDYLAARGNVE